MSDIYDSEIDSVEDVEYLLGDRYEASSEPDNADEVVSEFFSSDDDFGFVNDFIVK